ncbi:MAG: DUF2267 domain-containing protein [Thermodesulfobacteriota bacterium]
MDYQEFIEDIQSLSFIEDEETADAAIKAVLGIMSSSVEEDIARRMTVALPEPLNIRKLRGHQDPVVPVTFEQCVTQIVEQFQLEEANARRLTNAVLRSTRAALGGEKLGQIEALFPETWSRAIEHA